MSTRLRVFSSSVGTKLLIGVTGLALFLYLVIHIVGNLMVFFGPAAFNKYAFTLEGNPLVPIIEIGLLLIFLIHVYKTLRMFLENKTARPVRYAKKKYAGRPSRKTVASSTMIVSGLWLLVFIVMYCLYEGVETGVGGWGPTLLISRGYSAAAAANVAAGGHNDRGGGC